MSPKRPYIDQKGRRGASARQVRKKRKHRPLNRYAMEGESASTSRLTKKFKSSRNIDIAVYASFGYRIIDFLSVFSAISAAVKCKTCDGNVTFSETSCRGLGFKLLINCPTCEPISVVSSPLIDGKAYEINRRIIFIFKLLGLGYEALEKFCGFMDLPKTFTQSMYDKIITNIFQAAEAVGVTSMENAVKEEINLNDGRTDLTVSGGGTWKKYGFSSLIGYISGKVMDIITKLSYCKECEMWEKLSGTPEYDLWKEIHAEHCSNNHEESARRMEVDAIREMFQRSEEKYSVRYTNYVGDGDSETYKEILDIKPYKDVTITGKECIGHIQKQMGTRLLSVKKNKDFGGQGFLTDKLISELTIYYGRAIRHNSDSKENMKTAIWATFLHKISTDSHPRHDLCDSAWCLYLKAKQSNTLMNYVHPKPLPQIVQDAIRPIYEDLSADDLLARCEGGFTQTNNNSLNSLLCSIAPKTNLGDKNTADFASFTAVSVFNDGYSSILKMMQVMGLTIGPSSYSLYLQLDETRICNSEAKKYESSKIARQMLTAAKTNDDDSFLETETEVYEPGISD